MVMPTNLFFLTHFCRTLGTDFNTVWLSNKDDVLSSLEQCLKWGIFSRYY